MDSSLKNSRVGLIGFGALGQQVMDFQKDEVKDFVLFDDTIESQNQMPFASYKDYRLPASYLITLGYNHLKKKGEVHEELERRKKKILTFVHPTSFINSSAVLFPGTIIYPLCNIDAHVRIGKSVLLNNSVTISHDSSVSDFCFISPGVTVCGNVSIGKGCFIGAGTVITDGITIGDGCIIGAGSLISKNLPNNTSGVGNPFQVKSISLNSQ